MEDYEVRQALAIIKDRVNEITKEDDWKERLADEWNQANAEEAAAIRKSRPQPPAGAGNDSQNLETRSQVTYRKFVSFTSNNWFCCRFKRYWNF